MAVPRGQDALTMWYSGIRNRVRRREKIFSNIYRGIVCYQSQNLFFGEYLEYNIYNIFIIINNLDVFSSTVPMYSDVCHLLTFISTK